MASDDEMRGEYFGMTESEFYAQQRAGRGSLRADGKASAIEGQIADLLLRAQTAERERDQEHENHIRVNSALCKMIAKKNAARAALRKYGVHPIGAVGFDPDERCGIHDGGECTCGLDDALGDGPDPAEPTVAHAMAWCSELATQFATLQEAYVQLAVFLGVREALAREALAREALIPEEAPDA